MLYMAEKPLTAAIKFVTLADWSTGSRTASKNISGSAKTSQKALSYMPTSPFLFVCEVGKLLPIMRRTGGQLRAYVS